MVSLDSSFLIDLLAGGPRAVTKARAELPARGTPLGPSDLFIGVITRPQGERLLTRDRSFALVPGPAIESY
jgi:predicted nucleic acid-binding protein